MPPRRSERVATANVQRACAFPQFPLEFVLDIFLALPADQRLRAAEVCRGWRATVAMPALWRRLDLSPASGVAQPVSRSLLRAALARAGGALTSVDVSDANIDIDDLAAALRPSRALVEVRLGDIGIFPILDSVTLLLTATRQLRELHAGIACMAEEAIELLHSRYPFAPLRLHALTLFQGGTALPPALSAVLADERLQPCLKQLSILTADLSAPGTLDALVDDVVIRRRLSRICFSGCSLPPMAAPALARMLRNGALTDLLLIGSAATLRDAVSVMPVCDALRDNSTLTTIRMHAFLAPAATSIMGSLTGHRSLHKLDLSWSRLDDAAAAAALGVLLVADAPALQTLLVEHCSLGEAGLGVLCDALPHNNNLRKLDIRKNVVPADFMRPHAARRARQHELAHPARRRSRRRRSERGGGAGAAAEHRRALRRTTNKGGNATADSRQKCGADAEGNGGARWERTK